jgi:Ni,Fe-hydrogenase maturation factor|tara:strand:- start:555 stop:1100 length:546 start_codon:yes stop_codon:yes gene_type:complete
VVLNNILIGTVGYHLLRNHSVGPILLPQLNKKTWNDKVAIEEMNWGPIAIVQYFQTLEISFDRVIFLVALERLERKIGDITVYQWLGQLPDEKQIQACIGDAATGVISIENLLVIGEFFKIWPKEVFLIDVEPGAEQAGEHLTPEVEAKVPEILRILEELTHDGEILRKTKKLQGDTLFEE